MLPIITGPHLAIRPLFCESLLNPAASLASEINWDIGAENYPTLADALAAFDDFDAALRAKTGAKWYSELSYSAYYRDPHYFGQAGWAGSPSATSWPARASLACAPNLADPADLDERIEAYEVLTAAMDQPALAAAVLPLVDWVVRPLLRAWELAGQESEMKLSRTRSLVNFEVGMSGYWPQVRRLRRELLAPWFDGRRPTRRREFFCQIHEGLPDELAYLALRVGGGSEEFFDATDPILAPALAAAQAEHLLRPVYLGSGKSALFARSRHLALGLAQDEVLKAI